MIAFMEGALLQGVFHGDLHGGNLFVRPDGATVLLDFGITGRLDNRKRLAFLRLLVMGTAGDIRGQVQGLVDLGAFPEDTDIEAVIRDLDLDRPAKDPTKMSADELTSELKELTKKLLSYGATVPKELMLFVKNMVFLDGATATLAPELDILEEIQQIYMYFAQTHGERILRELGMDPTQMMELDLDAVKNSLGLDTEIERLTYKDLRARREMIQKRLQGKELS
jgi:ubiquinone biosynthesis protein